MIPGVRVVRLDPAEPVRVEIIPHAVPPDDGRIQAEWDRKRLLNPRLFDGPILSVRSISGNTITCVVDSYQRLVVQPEVETGVQMLSVTGVLTASSAGRRSVLLLRRSHNTRMYGGMWQNCPAGGVDVAPGAAHIDDAGLLAELRREVKEESGLDAPEGLTFRPVAMIFDETARSHDLIVPVHMGPQSRLLTNRGWESDELIWLDTGHIAKFEADHQGKIMAITQAVFRVMGWI